MPRTPRLAPGGVIYHVLNRANGRLRLFKTDQDYLAFEQILLQAHQHHPLPLLSYCIMPNHWHLVLHPTADGQLTSFLRWLTLTHAQRWKHAHAAVGHGHLYQGRFKSFPIQDDRHLLSVLRYVERNPLRAKLVKHAEDWPWCSAHARQNRDSPLRPLLHPWPIPRDSNWTRLLNSPQTDAEESAILQSIQRNRPFGDESWTAATARSLNLHQSLRPRGRPTGWRKDPKKSQKVANLKDNGP